MADGGFKPDAGGEVEAYFDKSQGLNTKHSHKSIHMKGVGYREDNGTGGKL